MQCTRCGGFNPDEAQVCKFCNNALVKVPEAPAPVEQPQPKGPVSDGTESLKKEIITKLDVLSINFLLNAAISFYNGIDVDKDERFAEQIFANIAMRGSPDAMFYYGQILMKGAAPNIQDATYWFKKAADLGHVAAKNTYEWLTRNETGARRSTVVGNGSASAPKIGDGSLADLANDALPSVLRIYSTTFDKSSTGSGFIVDGGLIVTNAHVIGASTAKVTAKFDSSISDNVYKLELIKMDSRLDIAVLCFAGATKDKILREEARGDRHFLNIREDETQFGESVYTIGNPLGLGTSLSAGHISNPHSDTVFSHPWKYAVQTDITVNGGNSGGALLDMNNNVVGMVTCSPIKEIGQIPMNKKDGVAVLGGADGMSFCVPAVNIIDFIKGVY